MRIAVTYDDGNIFQHFGHTEYFKIYAAEEGKIISSEVIGSEGTGHGALAGLLDKNGIDVLICGGIGSGAIDALNDAGIEVYAGLDGSADDAVNAFLAGRLVPSGANCSHHEEEGGCSGSCGGCSGGCHGNTPAFTGKNVGKTCKVHYEGTLNDGTKFDSSYDRGETLDFVCGAGMMIKGFDKAVADMEVGETVNIHLTPDEAYGEADPNAVFTVELTQLPGAEELEAGQQVYLQNALGQPFPVKVAAKDETTITFDANHEMAGKELNFKIELVEVC